MAAGSQQTEKRACGCDRGMPTGTPAMLQDFRDRKEWPCCAHGRAFRPARRTTTAGRRVPAAFISPEPDIPHRAIELRAIGDRIDRLRRIERMPGCETPRRAGARARRRLVARTPIAAPPHNDPTIYWFPRRYAVRIVHRFVRPIDQRGNPTMKQIRSFALFALPAALVAAGAHAQSSVTLYGIADAGIAYVHNAQNANGSNASSLVKFSSGNLSGSRWGCAASRISAAACPRCSSSRTASTSAPARSARASANSAARPSSVSRAARTAP